MKFAALGILLLFTPICAQADEVCGHKISICCGPVDSGSIESAENNCRRWGCDDVVWLDRDTAYHTCSKRSPTLPQPTTKPPAAKAASPTPARRHFPEHESLANTHGLVLARVPNDGYCMGFKQMVPRIGPSPGGSTKHRDEVGGFIRDVVNQNKAGKDFCERMRDTSAKRFFENDASFPTGDSLTAAQERLLMWRCGYQMCNITAASRTTKPQGGSGGGTGSGEIGTDRPMGGSDPRHSSARTGTGEIGTHRPIGGTDPRTSALPPDLRREDMLLVVCNRSAWSAHVAWSARLADQGNEWVVGGWQSVAPSQCAPLGRALKHQFYIYASTADGREWRGTFPLCVNPKTGFNYVNLGPRACTSAETLAYFIAATGSEDKVTFDLR
jgi:hypothetical protein